jgi:hypothetical protein
LPIFE